MTPDEYPRPYACPDCGRSFQVAAARDMHARTHEPPEAPLPGPDGLVSLSLSTGSLAALMAQLDRFHTLLHSVVTIVRSDVTSDAPTTVDRLHDSLEVSLALLELEVYPQLTVHELTTVLELRRAGRSNSNPIRTV